MFNNTQQCPTCGGAIHRENFSSASEGPGYFRTMMYCEFCDVGIETLWERLDGDQVREDFSLQYSPRTEPESLGKHLQRLQAARVG